MRETWRVLVLFFFKQKTAYEVRISDWSSDVCAADLRSGEDRPLLVESRHSRDRTQSRASSRASNCCTGVTAGASHPASSAATRSNRRSLTATIRRSDDRKSVV